MKSDNKDKKREIYLKINKNDSLYFKGIKPETKPPYQLVQQKNNSFFYENSNKKILFKNLTSASSASFEYSKIVLNNNIKKEYFISKNISEIFQGNEKEQKENREEKLEKMVEELNNIIKSKEKEINKIKKEKGDIELANQLFKDVSNVQIENLSKDLKTYIEKNE